MAYSQVEIANLVLVEFGGEVIAAMDQGGEDANTINAIFQPCLEEVLRAHPWNCATEYRSLPAASAAPLGGFTRAYPLPPDCLRVVRLGLEDEEPAPLFVVQGTKLLCNEEPPALVKIVKRMDDLSEMDAQLANVLALRIASKIAYKRTQLRTVAADIYQKYKEALADARTVNAQERRTRSQPAGRWRMAREAMG